MKYFKNIINLKQLKSQFRKLTKIYHPDNLTTGDKNKFIELKNEFEEVKKEIKNEKIIYISLEQAYKGCIIEYKNEKIKIPKGFYKHSTPLEINDEKVFIKIKNNNDFIYDCSNNIIPTVCCILTPLDLLLRTKKITIFGDEINLKLNNNLCGITLKNKGYYIRGNTLKRGDLLITFKLMNLELEEEDVKVIEGLKKKYD